MFVSSPYARVQVPEHFSMEMLAMHLEQAQLSYALKTIQARLTYIAHHMPDLLTVKQRTFEHKGKTIPASYIAVKPKDASQFFTMLLPHDPQALKHVAQEHPAYFKRLFKYLDIDEEQSGLAEFIKVEP